MNLYTHEKGLYLNITNRCPTACAFCVKKEWNWTFRGQDLRLEGLEPSVQELLDEMEEKLSRPAHEEIIFCGYGEPTMRLEAMSAVGLAVRRHHPEIPVRLNTVGLGSLVHGRDIVPQLAPFLNRVSVSLNTMDPAQWEKLHRPAPAYRGRGFAAAREFVERCIAAQLRTRITAIERSDVDLNALRAYAQRIGAEFLARPALI